MLNEERMLHSGEHGPLRRVPAIKFKMGIIYLFRINCLCCI